MAFPALLVWAMPAQTEKITVNYYWAWTYTWAGTLDASQPVLHQAIFIRACPITAVSNIISTILLKRLLNRWIIWTLTEKNGENTHYVFWLTGKGLLYFTPANSSEFTEIFLLVIPRYLAAILLYYTVVMLWSTSSWPVCDCIHSENILFCFLSIAGCSISGLYKGNTMPIL